MIGTKTYGNLLSTVTKSHERWGRPDINRHTCHELKQGPIGRRSSNARQLGCVFQDMKPPTSILRKSSDMQRPVQRVKFTKAVARHSTDESYLLTALESSSGQHVTGASISIQSQPQTSLPPQKPHVSVAKRSIQRSVLTGAPATHTSDLPPVSCPEHPFYIPWRREIENEFVPIITGHV